MVNYDNTYKLGDGQGSSQRASNQYIIIHDTANDNNQGDSSAQNEANYMHGNWQNAYTHAIAGWDRVYIVGEPGYVAYGAGAVANSRSPFQIELAHYSDPVKQKQSYANYIEAIREYAGKFGIPLQLDGAGNGVKSHKWISDNIWGDHQDPYAYLERIGISKSQLTYDIANGVNGKPIPQPIKGEIDMVLLKITDTKSKMNGSIWSFNGEVLVRLDGVSSGHMASYLKTVDTNQAQISHYVMNGIKTIGKFEW